MRALLDIRLGVDLAIDKLYSKVLKHMKGGEARLNYTKHYLTITRMEYTMANHTQQLTNLTACTSMLTLSLAVATLL